MRTRTVQEKEDRNKSGVCSKSEAVAHNVKPFTDTPPGSLEGYNRGKKDIENCHTCTSNHKPQTDYIITTYFIKGLIVLAFAYKPNHKTL